MQTIDTLEVLRHGGSKKIELLSGDLTELPPAHAVDVLVVSAFAGNYVPTPTSLVGALAAHGVDVAALAREPEVDLRRDFGCWLSRPLPEAAARRLNVRRILCFEPETSSRAAQLVGQIFQSLAPFTYAEPHIRSIALPMLATGDQHRPVAEMLPALLDASFNWLKQGFPLQTIKLVVRDAATLEPARLLFAAELERLWKQNDFGVWGIGNRGREGVGPLGAEFDVLGRRDTGIPKSAPPDYAYDVFVSYSRKDQEAAGHLESCLKAAGLRVFIDRVAISIGAAWQQKIFDALDDCNRVAVLYSPDFLQSKVCKEEFNIAWMRARDLERYVIFPLLIDETTLPTYMKTLNYVDCRIRDKPKIEAAAAELAASLK